MYILYIYAISGVFTYPPFMTEQQQCFKLHILWHKVPDEVDEEAGLDGEGVAGPQAGVVVEVARGLAQVVLGALAGQIVEQLQLLPLLEVWLIFVGHGYIEVVNEEK